MKLSVVIILSVLLISCSSEKKSQGGINHVKFKVQVVSVEPFRSDAKPQFIVNYPHKQLLVLRLLEEVPGFSMKRDSVAYLAIDEEAFMSASEVKIGNSYLIDMTEYLEDFGKYWDPDFKPIKEDVEQKSPK
jgi:hypothetical protein